MRKFEILTDSGCDMPMQYLQENGVICALLGFTMDGVNYGEGGEKISEQEFYAKLRGGAMPTT